MKRRSTIALILACLMIVLVFTGCSKGNENGQDKTPVDNPVKTDDPAKENDSDPQPVERQALTLSVYAEGLESFDPANDEIAKIMQDKFNITFEPIVFEEDGLKLAAASRSLPDVFETAPLFDVSLFNNWIRQEIVREVPDELINKYPAIKELMETNKTAIAAKKLLGKNYMVVKPNALDSSIYKVAWQGIFYRKDWAAKVGITKAPETYEELYDMLNAFVNNDPDGNGIKDTFGLTSNSIGLMTPWFTSWGVNVEEWIVEDGQWIPGYLSKKCIEPLRFIQRLYQDGLLDSEFAQNSPVQSMQKFSGNNFGAIARNSDVYWIYNVIKSQFGGANPDAGDPLELVGLVPPLAVDSSSQPAIAEYVDAYGVQFRNDLEDEKLDRYLEFHNWLLSDEAKYLLNLGIEGTHYSKTADGKIVTFNDPVTGQPYEISKLYPATNIKSIASWQFDLDADFNWPSTTIRDDIKQVAKEIRDLRNQFIFPTTIEASLISTPAKDSLEQTFYDDFSQMVMSKDDIEATFTQYVKDQLAIGTQDAIDEVNAEIERLGIK